MLANHLHQHGHHYMRTLLWVALGSGFGWTTYFGVPVIAVAGWHLLGDGILPDFSIKDIANVGGFAVFAACLYRLHVTTCAQNREDRITDQKQNRDDMAAERAHRESMTLAINANTNATQALTMSLNKKA